MVLEKFRNFVLLSNPLYFGWLLAVPYYGPVLTVAAPASVLEEHPLFLIFAVVHALTYLAGGLFLRESRIALNLMVASLTLTILTNAALLLSHDFLWLPAMVIFGVSSSLYVMGWVSFFSLYTPNVGRLKLMAAVIIWGNVIYLVFNWLASHLSAFDVLALALLPLTAAAAILGRFKFFRFSTSKKIRKVKPLLNPLIFIICLFVFVTYLNGGLMYSIIMPSIDLQIPYAFYYRYIIYILVLIVMYLFGEQLQRYFPIYMAVSLLGIAFVSFALFSEITAGLFLTASLLEAAFAMLDLFVWVTLGSLAFLYKAPFQFFGLALAAMLSGIGLGDYLGVYLFSIGNDYYLMTAIFASLSIFIVLLIVPWLNKQIENILPQSLEASTVNPVIPGQGRLGNLESHIQPGENLTPREIEIVSLVILGYTNNDIAAKLVVSPNTVKTHLKNIFNKFGVKKKKDLILLSSKGDEKH